MKPDLDNLHASIVEALKTAADEPLEGVLADVPAADIAEVMDVLDDEERSRIIFALPPWPDPECDPSGTYDSWYCNDDDGWCTGEDCVCTETTDASCQISYCPTTDGGGAPPGGGATSTSTTTQQA